MEILTLDAKIRKKLGKGLSALRKSGKIPGVLYGFNVENTPIELDAVEFEKIYREAGENTIIKLSISDKKDLKNDNILIQSVDRDPVTDKIIHVDLYAVRMDKKINVNVPLVFEGVSSVVKNRGGIMVKHLHELEIETLPTNVPREIQVDLSVLNDFEDTIKVGDLTLPEGTKALHDPKIVIITIEKPKTDEEIKKELEEAPKEAIEEVKVVGEKEKKEEGEEKTVEKAEEKKK